ncbi:MAG: hypothetical protein ABFD69_16780 [Candidatus Sumerlaeia bacterium]
MFGSPAKKLTKLNAQIDKALEAKDQRALGELFKKAFELVDNNDKDTSLDFLVAQQGLALKLLVINHVGQSVNMMGRIIARAERLGHERTAFYAMVCRSYAHLLRETAPGYEYEGREALEKGIRLALEGDKNQLLRLIMVIDKYTDELTSYKLKSWIPRIYKQAVAAFDAKVGADAVPTANMLVNFAPILMDSESADDQALALEAVDRILAIMAKSKLDPSDQACMLVRKAQILDKMGRTAEAYQLLRGTAGTAAGENAILVAARLAEIELRMERDPEQVESALDQAMASVKGRIDPRMKMTFHGIKGYCAALRGAESSTLECAARLMACRSEKTDVGESDIAEIVADGLVHIASALSHAGNPETALQVIDRATTIADSIDDEFPDTKQDLLSSKAEILAALGRNDEAEAILTDDILEKLDDENLLDTTRHADALIDLASVCINKKDYDRARLALKNAWAMSAERGEKNNDLAGHIYLWMGKLMMLTGQADRGAEALRRARETFKARGGGVPLKARAILAEYGC